MTPQPTIHTLKPRAVRPSLDGEPMPLSEALSFIDGFEQAGGRIICDGRMFAVTLPPESDAPVIGAEDLSAIMLAATHRMGRRFGGVA